MPEFPIIPSKTGMIFFDTLNRYLHPASPERQQAINESGVIQRMQKMKQACDAVGIPSFYPAADHRPDGKDGARQVVDRGMGGQAPDGQKGPFLTVPFSAATTDLVSGNPGVEIIPELAPTSEDYIIKKHRWSSFHQTHLLLSLRTRGIDTLMLAGGAIDIGIASTAYSARDNDFSLIVLRDICTGEQDILDMFMDRIFPKFARVMTVEEAISQFARD
jgi:nicotinamidase-related amidase